MTIDVGRALIVEANGAAGSIMAGAEADGRRFPIALDAAMPALVALRRRSRAGDAAESYREALVFWTRRGPLRLDCEISFPERRATARIRVVTGEKGGERRDPSRDGLRDTGALRLRHAAHELRTPLAAIASMADALHGGHLGNVSSDRHRDYLAAIRDTAMHALQVVEQMLEGPDGGRATGGEAKTAAAQSDVGAVIASLARSMGEMAARAGGRIIAEAVPGRLVARVETTALRRMLINLVTNALVHGGLSVTVRISAGPSEEESGWLWVEVGDSGRGLASVDVKGATNAAGEGKKASTGFGLAMTQSLAEQAGGRFELHSGPTGTRARLTLPLVQREA